MQTEGWEIWTDADEQAMRSFIETFQTMMAKLRLRPTLDVQEVEQKGRILDAIFGSCEPSPVKAASPSASKMLNLYVAIDAYVEAFKAKAVLPSHKERTEQLLGDLKHF
jgi:hypothetical protein